jgi:hypothetical protein
LGRNRFAYYGFEEYKRDKHKCNYSNVFKNENEIEYHDLPLICGVTFFLTYLFIKSSFYWHIVSDSLPQAVLVSVYQYLSVRLRPYTAEPELSKVKNGEGIIYRSTVSPHSRLVAERTVWVISIIFERASAPP